MPELPEVETVRRDLADRLTGRRVDAVTAESTKLRRPLPVEALVEHMPGAVFGEARRHGKFLLLPLETGTALVHLGMTGRLELCLAERALAPHTHLVVALEGGDELRYADVRRFGFVDWLAPGGERNDPSLSRLGVDPLSEGYLETVPGALKRRRGPIKHVIMDQSVIAGVGNIYACEALWMVGIDPRRKAHRVSMKRLRALTAALRDVMVAAIASGGTTVRDYAGADGRAGSFSQRLRVYGREGEACPRCGQGIVRSVSGGRSTFWCRGCQR